MEQNHSKAYKNKGKDVDDLRRRRQEVTVELRKNKRDDALLKKRNVGPIENEVEDNDVMENFLPSDLKQLVLNAMSPDLSLRLSSTKMIRKLLSSDKYLPIDEVINTGVLPILVESLKCIESPGLQFEAAWALTNIASGTTEQTKKVVEAEAVPLFIQLLSSSDKNVSEQAVWALGNIIGDGPQLRDYVLGQGLLQPLLKLFEQNPSPSLSYMRNLTWVIVNLCRNKSPAPSIQMVGRLMPVLLYLLKSISDELILIDAIWSVSYITDHGNDQIQMVIDSGIVDFVIPFLTNEEPRIQTPALRVIGNIATGTDSQTNAVLQLNALHYVPKLLEHPKDRIRKETLWFLSNITAGNVDQIQLVIDSNLVASIIQYMTCANFNLQREAAWAISNLTLNGTPEQVKYLFSLNVIPPICHLLACSDVQVIEILLEAISKLFAHFEDHTAIADEIEKCGGLDTLESLQNHENQEIYNKSYAIIEKYFSCDDDQHNLGPEGNGQEFEFGTGGADGTGQFQF